jgi:hypothetical protein
MGDRCCTLSASTSFFSVNVWKWYADSAAATALATRKDRSTMTSVDPHRVRQSKVRRWTVAVRPLPLCSAARDSAAADGSSCLWIFRARAASHGHQPDFVQKVAHRLDGQPRSHGELKGVRRAPATLPREGRHDRVALGPAD